MHFLVRVRLNRAEVFPQVFRLSALDQQIGNAFDIKTHEAENHFP